MRTRSSPTSPPMRSALRSEHGFSLTELMVTTTITLVITGAALGSFRQGLSMSDHAAQFADVNQNLRAGVNQMVKDLMQAGRIIGPEGVPIPSGAGAAPVRRPAPPGVTLTFDTASTTNMPDITTGYAIGPTVNGQPTDIVTIISVDAFMPAVETPPSGGVDPNEGTIDPSGASVTLPANSLWIAGDPANDTPPIRVGDIILFKNPRS